MIIALIIFGLFGGVSLAAIGIRKIFKDGALAKKRERERINKAWKPEYGYCADCGKKRSTYTEIRGYDTKTGKRQWLTFMWCYFCYPRRPWEMYH